MDEVERKVRESEEIANLGEGCLKTIAQTGTQTVRLTKTRGKCDARGNPRTWRKIFI